MGGSVGLIVGSSYGDFFFFEWVCFWFWFWFDGGGVALGWWILILVGFCSAEVGGVTEKLDDGVGGGWWLRERNRD